VIRRPPSRHGASWPALSLQPRGVAVGAVAVSCITFGELAAAGTVVTVGLMAAALLAAAAVMVVVDWYGTGRWVTVALVAGSSQVPAGYPLAVWVQATLSTPSRSDRWSAAPQPGGLGLDLARVGGRSVGSRSPATRRWFGARRPLVVEVDDPASTMTLRRGSRLVDIKPGRTARAAAVGVVVDGPPVPIWLAPPQRGLLGVGPALGWLVDPMAMIRVRLSAAPGVDVVVTPAVVAPDTTATPITGFTVPLRHLGGGGTMGPQVRPAAERSGDELVGVAPVRPGEVAGRVHWPTTLRTGETATLRFGAPQPDALTVVVGLDTRPRVHDEASMEAAVARAAAFGIDALHRHRRVELVAGVASVHIQPGRSAVAELLRWLALVDTDTDTDTDTGIGPGPGPGRRPGGVAPTGVSVRFQTSPRMVVGNRPVSVVVTTAAGSTSLPAGSTPGAVFVVPGGPGSSGSAVGWVAPSGWPGVGTDTATARGRGTGTGPGTGP